jgi:hypothetical protein
MPERMTMTDVGDLGSIVMCRCSMARSMRPHNTRLSDSFAAYRRPPPARTSAPESLDGLRPFW